MSAENPLVRLDRDKRIRIACVLLAMAVFVFDLFTPRDVASGVLYVGVVLLTLWLAGRRVTLLAAGCCSALTIAGFFLCEEGAKSWWVPDASDRLLALIAIWVTAALTILQKRATQEVVVSET